MLYKPYSMTPPPAPSFFPRSKNISPVNERNKSQNTKPAIKISPNKITENPQEKRKQHPAQQKKWLEKVQKSLANTIKHSTESVNYLRKNQTKTALASHNLSTNNLRTTFSPIPFARRERQALTNATELQKQVRERSPLQIKRSTRNEPKKEEKKCKETPSFIRNKNTHISPTSPSIEDFKIIKTVRETQEYKETVGLHIKTKALFVIKAYKKVALSKEKELCEEIKFYLKNLQITHSLIVKCFGFFSEGEYFYLIEEFLAGETMQEYMSQRKQRLNEQEVGAKVCEILTALTYLNSLQFSYGNLTQANIVHSLNVCKLKRPYLIYQKKDLLFDIWCLGKLVFQMVTLCCLVDQNLLEGMHSLKDLFSSSQIVLALEVGFKQFEGSLLSRDLITFLVATLWDIQNEELTLEQVWDLEFVKLYKEEYVWHSRPEK